MKQQQSIHFKKENIYYVTNESLKPLLKSRRPQPIPLYIYISKFKVLFEHK
jgi:hypothetical protein